MKKIKLTQGKYALVDDGDFEWLSQRKWHVVNKKGNYYAVRKQYLGTVDGKELFKTIYMARLIMETPNDLLCDHKDGNTLNNQKTNLRNCTKSENLLNRGPQKNNTSGFKNVYWHAQDKMWRVIFVRNGVKHDCGLYKDLERAKQARDYFIGQINGKFARTEVF